MTVNEKIKQGCTEEELIEIFAISSIFFESVFKNLEINEEQVKKMLRYRKPLAKEFLNYDIID